MAWQDETIPLLRLLIGDSSSPYTYCDTRLLDLFVGAAKMVVMELSFDDDYTITLSTSSISPDPSDDPYFIPLASLRAAYLIANSEYRTKSLMNIVVSDGPSTINLSGVVSGLKARVERLLADYNQAKLQYSIGNAIGCQAVLTPYTTENSIYPLTINDIRNTHY